MTDLNQVQLVDPDTGSKTVGMDGAMILVNDTTSPGVQLHRAPPGRGTVDMVSIVGFNGVNAATRTLTIEWGMQDDSASTWQRCTRQLAQHSGATLMIDSLPLSNGMLVRGFADNATDVAVIVRVLRYPR